MIKRMEIKPKMECRINKDIQGLRKKKTAFAKKPASQKWWHAFASFERNGQLNLMLSRNWVRLVFPLMPMFLFMYVWQPILHGTIYIKHYNNFQWEALYFKFSMNRPLFTDQTITRLA